jgi:hypothetical protein
MDKYKVKESFETPAVEASEGVEAKEAVTNNVDDIIEMTPEQAAALGEKVEKLEA